MGLVSDPYERLSRGWIERSLQVRLAPRMVKPTYCGDCADAYQYEAWENQVPCQMAGEVHSGPNQQHRKDAPGIEIEPQPAALGHA